MSSIFLRLTQDEDMSQSTTSGRRIADVNIEIGFKRHRVSSVDEKADTSRDFQLEPKKKGAPCSTCRGRTERS